jgi:hypothetical protein
MSGALQAVFQNQRSFGPPAIGDAYAGGFYAGKISTAGNGVADFYLVIGPKSTAQNSSIRWRTSPGSIASSSVIDGPTNSSQMNSATYPAGQFCEGLTIGGFSDWYMPAKNELEVCYYNLKPTTISNNTTVGANTNAVPSRGSNYTTGTPAQTSAVSFQDANAEAFDNAVGSPGYYWSSTQININDAWSQTFRSGYQLGLYKSNFYRVRAVRRVAV